MLRILVTVLALIALLTATGSAFPLLGGAPAAASQHLCLELADRQVHNDTHCRFDAATDAPCAACEAMVVKSATVPGGTGRSVPDGETGPAFHGVVTGPLPLPPR